MNLSGFNPKNQPNLYTRKYIHPWWSPHTLLCITMKYLGGEYQNELKSGLKVVLTIWKEKLKLEIDNFT